MSFRSVVTWDQSQSVGSVIVAAYNYGHFIVQTLDSLTAQTLKNREYIVVEDGSTENTLEVV